jgi:hypothetical protein
VSDCECGISKSAVDDGRYRVAMEVKENKLLMGSEEKLYLYKQGVIWITQELQ